ncbi:MAG: hypothetical protein Q9181_000348 [Wetmoreana brouardii]
MVKLMSPREPPLLIAVLGVTGSGKTTFISKASGRTDLNIGYGIESCTKDLSVINCTIAGRTVSLIDTPGFDDTDRTDVDVLRDISRFLHETYEEGTLLSGIILLQPVSGNKIQGNENRRLRLFKKICGPQAYSHVIIGTTMWSELSSSTDGRSRIESRKESYWDDMIAGGAKVEDHDNTQVKAIEIIKHLIDKSTIVLQLQRELRETNGIIGHTSAGRQLLNDMGEDHQKVMQELEELRNEVMRGNATKEELRQEIQELEEQRAKNEEQQEKLKRSKVRCYPHYYDISP